MNDEHELSWLVGAFEGPAYWRRKRERAMFSMAAKRGSQPAWESENELASAPA